MDLLENPAILRQIIMDHYQYPRNKSLVVDPNYHKIHMASESCIDDFTIQVLIENEVIQDIRYDGIGCTISTAALSILSELLKGKSQNEALEIIDEYYAMIHEADYHKEKLAEAVVFANVGKQANRIKCATIGANGIKMLVKGEVNGEE